MPVLDVRTCLNSSLPVKPALADKIKRSLSMWEHVPSSSALFYEVRFVLALTSCFETGKTKRVLTTRSQVED